MRHTTGNEGVSGSFKISPEDGSFFSGTFMVDTAAQACDVSIDASDEDVQSNGNKTKVEREASIFPSFIEQENFEKSCGRDANVHSFVSTLWGSGSISTASASGKLDELCYNKIFTAKSNADDIERQFDKSRNELEVVTSTESAQIGDDTTTDGGSIVQEVLKPPPWCRYCQCYSCRQRRALHSLQSTSKDSTQPHGGTISFDQNSSDILNWPDFRSQRIQNPVQSSEPTSISNIQNSVPPAHTTHLHNLTSTIAKDTANILQTTNREFKHRSTDEETTLLNTKDDTVDIVRHSDNSFMTLDCSADRGPQETDIQLNDEGNRVRSQEKPNDQHINNCKMMQRTDSESKDHLAMDDNEAINSEECIWDLKETMAEFDDKFPDEDNEANLYDTVSQYGKAAH